MLTRIEDYFAYLGVSAPDRERGLAVAWQYGEIADGMTHRRDYEALAAVALHFQPRRIFEIGTYLGVTSDFFLTLLPESEVVSIAFVPRRWSLRNIRSLRGRQYNNTELTRRQVGSKVDASRRKRFTQLHGDSHQLQAASLIQRFGKFDLVFIDGDHSAQGVKLDTELAQPILSDNGVICWHDANPKTKYLPVRRYLEDDLKLHALATTDDYIGGVATWNPAIARPLEPSTAASP
ncbi:MAG: class I SAM-dependent methyltransferase [Planctomycetota bacterium]